MDIADWTDFFSAQVGASAPLLGLLFVGVSLNLDKILSFPSLTDRAAMGMGMLFTVLVTGSLMLVPGQPLRFLGAEVFAVGLFLLTVGTRFQLRILRAAADRGTQLENTVIFWLAAVPYIIGGALLFFGKPAGFYVVAAAVLLSLMKAILDAWVLLVEINR